MNEAQTRLNKIDPKLRDAGWGIVLGSNILVEQSAYIAPGRLTASGNKNPKKADYILEYKGMKLAVIEAKSDEKDVSEGVGQAKLYADALKIRYTYSTNGDEIWFIDMGVKDSKGEYIIPSKEYDINTFPTPQDLWQMTFPEENPWRDKFNLCALNRSGGRQPRYYQEIAIKNVLEAVAKQRNRILLTMATGTGKTYTAFQICWKLTQTKWNTKGAERAPRILFIADRNILANQAINDFDQFPEDAMCRVTPKELRKNHYRVPTARNLYFTIFQTMMTSPNAQKAEEQGIKLVDGSDDQPYYMQYERDFFDFIIIDECHRGGANDESEWRKLMEYFDSAYQLGMTATPKRNVNSNTYAYFGEPVYTYSLKQGIEDGYLVPFRVDISTSNIDDYKYEEGDIIKSGEIDLEKVYSESDFYNGRIQIKERDEKKTTSKSNATIKLTASLLESYRLPNGWFSKKQIKALGIPTPAPKNWIQKYDGLYVTFAQFEAFKRVSERLAAKQQSAGDVKQSQVGKKKTVAVKKPINNKPKHPERHGRPWTKEEDDQLKAEFGKAYNYPLAIANKHQRSLESIKARLAFLGLI